MTDHERARARVVAQIDGSLAEAGSDKSKLIEATIWLADMATFGEMNAAWILRPRWRAALSNAGAHDRVRGERRRHPRAWRHGTSTNRFLQKLKLFSKSFRGDRKCKPRYVPAWAGEAHDLPLCDRITAARRRQMGMLRQRPWRPASVRDKTRTNRISHDDEHGRDGGL